MILIRLILGLLLTASIALGATGDIQSVTVRSDGWTADVAIDGLNTGGTYDFGLGANNAVSGSPKVVFTVVSHGYNETTLGTKTRTVYGVWPMRKPYPDTTTNEETNSGGVTTVRIILSDYIYDEDDAGAGNSGTAITATFLSGFYTQSATPTNATSSPITVTNNSTVPFQEVIRNWSWPGFQRMDSTTKLRFLAFHRHGEQSKPVNAVRVSVTDGTSTNYETITTPSVDLGFGDAKPVVEYVTTTDLTAGLTQGAELTINAIAYPWVGDNAGDTSTGASSTPTAPSPLVGPQKAVCDRTGGYGVTYAVVDGLSGSDPAVGSDSGKWRGDGADPGSGSGVTAYATIARAARAIRDYNSANRSRDDVGGGIIYVKAGSYNWLGATISGTYGAAPKTWITVKPFTGVARSDVTITGSTGNTDISDLVKLENLTINTTTNNTFSGCLTMWLHGCDLTSTATGTWNSTGQVIYMTQCDVRAFTQGLRPVSTSNVAFGLVRGCTLDGFDDTILTYTVIGNSNPTQNSMDIRDTVSGMGAPRPVPIVAFNEFLGLTCTAATCVKFGNDSGNTTGIALVQNVFENYSTGEGGMASIGISNYEHSNYILWNNSFVGQRNFIGYNDSGSVAYYRKYWSQVNNYFDRWANKCDNDIAPNDGNRVGGWPVKFGIGSSGNYYSQNMVSLPGNFYAEFAGLSSYQPSTSTYGEAVDADFIDRQSAVRGASLSSTTLTAGAGEGDYDIADTSPLIGLPIINVVGYDLDGVERQISNAAAGAYVVAAPEGGGSTSTINAGTTTATSVSIQ